MKRCASCGHPEIDHEGLACRSPEKYGCQCNGFEDPDEPEDAFGPAPIDALERARGPREHYLSLM